MIIIALGSNVPGPWGNSSETLDQAVKELANNHITVVARSSWIETKPYGVIDQPSFVNGAVQVKTQLPPEKLLKILQKIEGSAGRKRREKWGPRTLDLDIIAYDNVILEGSQNHMDLTVPHADLHNRSFVLLPILELDPGWHHPVTGKTVVQMLEALELKSDKDLPEISKNDQQ